MTGPLVLDNGGEQLGKYWNPTANIDFDSLVSLGIFSNIRGLIKFGRNVAVGTSLADIATPGGVYAWPQTATNIQISSNEADDTLLGDGARVVRVQGLDSNFDELEEDVAMDGVTPVILANKYLRISRAFVVTSGAYGTTTTNSHVGTLTIEDQGGAGTTHIEIGFDGALGIGQSVIARYTVPRGWRGVLKAISSSIDSNKVASIYFNIRINSDDPTTAPFGAKRTVGYKDGLTGPDRTPIIVAGNAVPAMTDIWVSAKAEAADTKIESTFELWLFQEPSLMGG